MLTSVTFAAPLLIYGGSIGRQRQGGDAPKHNSTDLELDHCTGETSDSLAGR